ncbi:uncharacterized protein LOC113972788 [Neopelma chrysocephalum]|uniref:uncharacterized protein LOC113972788 n=1 Tax=Neopelma chrysocephalum TaxID=114329 RepID=UPI000FCCEFA5|nr:uncharacterized protein LOC113972788 [Neopelma chrysocephalum]
MRCPRCGAVSGVRSDARGAFPTERSGVRGASRCPPCAPLPGAALGPGSAAAAAPAAAADVAPFGCHPVANAAAALRLPAAPLTGPSPSSAPSDLSAPSLSSALRPPRRLPPSLHAPPVPLPRPLSSGAGKSCEFLQWWREWRGGGRVAHPWFWGLQGLGFPRPRRQVKPSVCGLAKAGSSGRRGHACLKRPERGQPPAALGTWSSGPGGCESGKHKAALDNCSSAFKYCDSELLSKREHSDASDIEENLCNYPAVLTPLREVVLDHRQALPSNKIPCYHSPKAEWRYKAAMSVSNFRTKKWRRVALRPQDRYAVIRLPWGSGSKSSIGIKSLNMYKNLNPFHLWPRSSISTGEMTCQRRISELSLQRSPVVSEFQAQMLSGSSMIIRNKSFSRSNSAFSYSQNNTKMSISRLQLRNKDWSSEQRQQYEINGWELTLQQALLLSCHSSMRLNVGQLTPPVMKILQQAVTFKVLEQDSYQDWSWLI